MADRCQLAYRVSDKLFSGRLPMKKPSSPITAWKVSFYHGGGWRPASGCNECRTNRRLRRQPNPSCVFTRTNAFASCLQFERLVKFRCTSCTTHGTANERFYCCTDFVPGDLAFSTPPSDVLRIRPRGRWTTACAKRLAVASQTRNALLCLPIRHCLSPIGLKVAL